MLKSQRHYYWIGGAIWGVLMLGGVVFVAGATMWGDAEGIGEAFDSRVFPQSKVVTGDAEKQGAVVIEAGAVDIGAGGLTLTDPVEDPTRAPFDLDVPEGRFEVEIFVPADAPKVIGMVALRFSDAEVTTWEKPGRKSHPLDFDFGIDDLVALGDPEAVAVLDVEEVKTALGASTGQVLYATVFAEGRQVLIYDPNFETFSADVYAGYDANGDLTLVVKDYGYFGTRAALEDRE